MKINFNIKAVTLIGLLAAVLIFTVIRWDGFAGKAKVNQPVFKARRGPLAIDVLTAGTIKARDQLIIKNLLEGKTTILWLVPEAARVEKGDLLVELDASRLEDDKIKRQIDVQNARAAFIKARETLAVAKNKALSEVEKAELTLEFAVHDLEKYKEGEYPNELKEAAFKIALANEELTRAREKLKWSRVLFKDNYISQTELTADELSAKKADLELTLSKNRENLLKAYTYRRKVAELSSNVSQAKMALERTRRKVAADVVQAEAELIAAETKLKRQEKILEKIEDQIGKAKIYAPASGVVVYATSAKASWRGNDQPLAEGREVREREELIHLPTTKKVKAEVKIHEAFLNKIETELPVEITVDAVPGRVYEGKVVKTALLPDAQSMWLNPDLKVYSTEIYLDGEDEGLRTGMSCSARIIVKTLEDALFVPIQCVVRKKAQSVVYVANGEGSAPRPVVTGLDNGRMIIIEEGIAEGAPVLLAPPLDASENGEG